jgi:hypothetical protein
MAEERPGYNPRSSGKQVGKTTPRKIISLSNHFKGVVPRSDTDIPLKNKKKNLKNIVKKQKRH